MIRTWRTSVVQSFRTESGGWFVQVDVVEGGGAGEAAGAGAGWFWYSTWRSSIPRATSSQGEPAASVKPGSPGSSTITPLAP